MSKLYSFIFFACVLSMVTSFATFIDNACRVEVCPACLCVRVYERLCAWVYMCVFIFREDQRNPGIDSMMLIFEP